jgi:NhaP-type Na+/H+ or K+/H+ antiporter
MPHHAALTIALALGAGMAVQCAARSIRVPAIILLLASGIALGPTGLGWVRPADLGEGLFIVVDFAVAIILFEGALNLKVRRILREERVIRRLVTLGAVVTLLGGAVAARAWLGWTWTLAVLFGSLVVVTGPTVVGPLVRDLRLHPRLQTVLEAEGVLIDPIGALLAVLVLQITLASDALGVVSEFGALFARLTVGVLCGALGGLLIAGLLRVPALVHGFENALTLALVVLLFHVSEFLMAPSGLVAVTAAGLVVGNLKSPVDEDLREFKDQLTVLMIGAVFVLLAADIGMEDVRALGWRGAAVLGTLVLVVRPAGVWLATRGTGMAARERLFVSAIAPRGIVAAAIASLTAGTLSARAIPGGPEIRALVFLVIAGTVVAAGLAAWPLAALLRLRLPARDRIAILGAQGLGIALGRELRSAGRTVVFVDADPQRCRLVEDDGFPVVFGDALQERTLRRIPVELVGTAIGATYNDNLNSQFVGLARQTFGVKVGLVLVDSLEGDRAPQHVTRQGADVLFGAPHDQERWDVYWRQGQVEILKVAWGKNGERQPAEGHVTGPAEAGPPAQGARPAEAGPHAQGTHPAEAGPHVQALRARGDVFALLTLERGGRTVPMSLAVAPRKGDRAAVAVHAARREDALTQLEGLGWAPAAAAEPGSATPEAT